MLSTVAARSKIGQLFLPCNHHWWGQPRAVSSTWSFVGLACGAGWLKGSEIEACRAESLSFVQEQRQVERSSTGSHPDVGDVLLFCRLHEGFSCLPASVWSMCRDQYGEAL